MRLLDIVVTHYNEPWEIVEKFFKMMDLQRIRFPVFNVGWPWPHTLLFRYDHGGSLMERKLLLRSPKIYACYNSYALLKPIEFAGEQQPRRVLVQVRRRAFGRVLGPVNLRRFRRLVRWQPSPLLTFLAAFAAVLILRVLWSLD